MEKDITIHGFYFDPALGLQVDDLKKMPAGAIFAKGELPNGPAGINMTNNSNRMIRWIAKRGYGYHDWAIYCSWATYEGGIPLTTRETEWDYIKVHGVKITIDVNIKQCINASDEAMKLYRK